MLFDLRGNKPIQMEHGVEWLLLKVFPVLQILISGACQRLCGPSKGTNADSLVLQSVYHMLHRFHLGSKLRVIPATPHWSPFLQRFLHGVEMTYVWMSCTSCN